MRRLIAVTGRQEVAPVDYQLQIQADVVARTMWGEARGEGIPGMQAVANVVINRVKVAKEKNGYWWGMM